MASRFRVPRQPTPQPDRDFSFGARPQDTLNRIIPGQQGTSGGIAGLGQANSFKPKAMQMKRRSPQAVQQAQSAQAPGGVKMTFAGDPHQLAQTVQALVNNTGGSGTLPADPAPSPLPDPRAATPPGFGHGTLPTDPGPGNVITDPNAGGYAQQDPAVVTPVPPPQVSTPVSEFASLSDYLNAVGGLDLIDENAYKQFSGWTPQLPEYAQQKIALDNQLQSQLVQAVGSQETAKAMQKLILSRLVEDELSDQALNREASASRGLGSSSIKAQNADRINKGYMREAGTGYANLVSELMGLGSGLSGRYGDYLTNISGLASDEAGALYQAGLGAGSPPPSTEKTKTPKDRIGNAKRVKRKKKKKGGGND